MTPRAKLERLIDACDGSRELAGAKIGCTMAEVFSYATMDPPTSIQQAIDRALAKLGVVTEPDVPPAMPRLREIPPHHEVANRAARQKETTAMPATTSRFHPKDCTACGKPFPPRGPRQMQCDRCRSGAAAPKPEKPKAAPKQSKPGRSLPAVRTPTRRRHDADTTPARDPANGHGLVQAPTTKAGLADLSTRSQRASELFGNIARDSAELAELLG